MIDAPQDSNHFDRSTIRLSLGDHVVTCEPTTVRTEIRRDRFIAVASIVTQAIAVGDPAHYGFVVDLDVICNGPFDSGWDDVFGLVDDAHNIEKEVFFSLLTQDTIDQYEPEY